METNTEDRLDRHDISLDDIPDETFDQVQESIKVRHYIFQLIDHENGRRSEPLTGTYDTLAEILKEAKDRYQKPEDDDYILLVAVIGNDDEDTLIPGTPLIRVGTFLDTVDPTRITNRENEETQNG